jgi:hypothetical protein
MNYGKPTIYVPYTQVTFFNMTLSIHTRDSAVAVRKSVAGVLQSVDPDQPIHAVNVFDDFLPDALADGVWPLPCLEDWLALPCCLQRWAFLP